MNKQVKCIVWDLDNTIWDGVLVEGDHVVLKDGMAEVIKALDHRGILQSIASKNEHDLALNQLKEFGLLEYFIFPQINWNSKADSVQNIADTINIGIDTLAFIDDQLSEREEVSFYHHEVLVIDAKEYNHILEMNEFIPRGITKDGKSRRLMYQQDVSRNIEEKEFTGSREEFLGSLQLELNISPITEGDLDRVIELTERTNQLNSTGHTYAYEELKGFIDSENYIFLIAKLKDRLGNYGKIGITLLEKKDNQLVIKLLLMSCRVMTKGVGTALLVHLIKLSQKENKELFAEFKHTDRNRIMYITYKMMGFDDIEEGEVETMLQYTSSKEKAYPKYIHIN